MSLSSVISFLDSVALPACLFFMLVSSIVLTFSTRFVQFRSLGTMFSLFFSHQRSSRSEHTIQARRALFTAMSTTIGIGNIVAPIVAIGVGGPGALLGFVLATIFGAASTFTEVALALNFRKRRADGTYSGGPMHYLKEGLHKSFAFIYALGIAVLLAAWSASQANQLAVILQPFGLPRLATGLSVALFIIYLLISGIKTIGRLAEKLVPVMFCLYVSAMVWVIWLNAAQLPAVFNLIITSAFSPQALAGAGLGVGLMRALQPGLAKAYFSNESGLGTATIPHSASSSHNAINQGILAMLSVYTNGLLCLLSGIVILITGVWQDASLPFDISMMRSALSSYFPHIGVAILTISAALFSFSTILGNSYNGSQCFLYVTRNSKIYVYYAFIASMVVLGAASDVDVVWKAVDFFLIPVAIPHIIGIVLLSFKRRDLITVTNVDEDGR